jgi:hypothetical protein
MKAKPRGLMPNHAARTLHKHITRQAEVSVHRAISMGALDESERQERIIRLHIQRVDAWLKLLEAGKCQNSN